LYYKKPDKKLAAGHGAAGARREAEARAVRGAAKAAADAAAQERSARGRGARGARGGEGRRERGGARARGGGCGGGSGVNPKLSSLDALKCVSGATSIDVGQGAEPRSVVAKVGAKLEKSDGFWATSELPGGAQATNSPAAAAAAAAAGATAAATPRSSTSPCCP
jgi:hypothetical protein